MRHYDDYVNGFGYASKKAVEELHEDVKALQKSMKKLTKMVKESQKNDLTVDIVKFIECSGNDADKKKIYSNVKKENVNPYSNHSTLDYFKLK